MSTLPWRVVVITDLGVDSAGPAPVSEGTLDAWFESLGLPAAPATLSPTAMLAAGVPASGLDAALHDPARQRIEAAWRGLKLLLQYAGDAVRIEAMSGKRASLVSRFREAVHGPELVAAEPVALVVLDYDFTHKSSDLAALAELAAMAAEIQAPIVANAGAGFFDLRFLVQAGAVKDLAGRVSDAAHAGWTAFQKGEDARWVCLTLNRFLLREPWALEGWRESCSDSNPDTYLWGRGGWLVAAAVARSVREHGHTLAIAGQGARFDDMPTRPFPMNANESRALSTESPVPEATLLELTHAAFASLSGGLGRSTIAIPTLVTAHRYGAGKLTVEGTLAYQLTASRVALACGVAAGTIDGETGDAAVRATLERRLTEELGTLLGGAADGLDVEIVTAQGDVPRHAAITVKPPIPVEGKSPQFRMDIGLEA